MLLNAVWNMPDSLWNGQEYLRFLSYLLDTVFYGRLGAENMRLKQLCVSHISPDCCGFYEWDLDRCNGQYGEGVKLIGNVGTERPDMMAAPPNDHFRMYAAICGWQKLSWHYEGHENRLQDTFSDDSRIIILLRMSSDPRCKR